MDSGRTISYGAPSHGWTMHSAPDGTPYYYNERTGVSSWEMPPEMRGKALQRANDITPHNLFVLSIIRFLKTEILRVGSAPTHCKVDFFIPPNCRKCPPKVLRYGARKELDGENPELEDVTRASPN